MGKYYRQKGHYRTYKDSGKTISVNGGPGSGDNTAFGLIGLFMIGGFMYTYPLSILLFLLLFGVFTFAFSKDGEHTLGTVLSGLLTSTIVYGVIMVIYYLATQN
jgi:hypothetical protein